MAKQSRFAQFLAGYGQLTLFMLPIGVAMNFVGGQIATLLKLPIYLDSIGTVLVGALCGGIPGALVGVLSNVINSVTNPTTLFYGVLSIGIGACAGLFSRLGWFTRYWSALLCALPLAIIGGAGGALITIWLFGGLTPSGNGILAAAIHAVTGWSLPVSVYLAGVPFDVIDKLITVTIVFLILRRMPARLLLKLPLGKVYFRSRKPIDVSDIAPASIDPLAFPR